MIGTRPIRLLLTGALSVPLALTAATVAAPAAHAVDLIDNTGDSDAPTDPTYVPMVPDAGLTATKLQDLAVLKPQVAALMAGQEAGMMCLSAVDSTNCTSSPPAAKTLSNVTIYRQETGYTCAPASARTVLSSFGISTTEASLAKEMKTQSSNGTYWVNLRDTLNRRQSRDYFIGEPEYSGLTPDELISRVVYDVARVRGGYYHPAVLNVDQYRLSYWGNSTRTGRHYLVSHGYDTRNQGKLVLGDVAGGHHGKHTVSLAEAHTAVVANKGLVLF